MLPVLTTLLLGCSDELFGIEAQFNYCPVIDYVNVSPVQQPLGEAISLAAGVFDENGDVVVFKWEVEPPGNSFDDALALETRFNCRISGTHTLRFTASDGMCDVDFSLDIACFLPESAGDPSVEDGGAPAVVPDGGEHIGEDTGLSDSGVVLPDDGGDGCTDGE